MVIAQALPAKEWREAGIIASKQRPVSPAWANDTNGRGSRLKIERLIRSIKELTSKNARLHESILAGRERVIEAEEQARKRVAGDLHDGPTQLVSAMVMRLDYCRQLLTRDPALLPDELDALQEIGERAIHQMRTMLFELRPLALETHGLAAALQVFLERRQKEVEPIKLILEIGTSQSNDEISRQEAEVEAAVFAIAQEAVNNALKHARAGCIAVHLEETPTAIYTMIADDGKGFDVAAVMHHYGQQSSLGMVNMRERAELVGGELIVKSTPGQGTHIIVKIPKAKAERMRKRRATRRLSLPFN